MNTAVDHVLIIMTVMGQVMLGAFTGSHEDCEHIRRTTQRTIDLHNQERPKGFHKVQVVLMCSPIDKDKD